VKICHITAKQVYLGIRKNFPIDSIARCALQQWIINISDVLNKAHLGTCCFEITVNQIEG
jgi:hypothetical protein